MLILQHAVLGCFMVLSALLLGENWKFPFSSLIEKLVLACCDLLRRRRRSPGPVMWLHKRILPLHYRCCGWNINFFQELWNFGESSYTVVCGTLTFLSKMCFNLKCDKFARTVLEFPQSLLLASSFSRGIYWVSQPVSVVRLHLPSLFCFIWGMRKEDHKHGQSFSQQKQQLQQHSKQQQQQQSCCQLTKTQREKGSLSRFLPLSTLTDII